MRKNRIVLDIINKIQYVNIGAALLDNRKTVVSFEKHLSGSGSVNFFPHRNCIMDFFFWQRNCRMVC